MYASYSSSGSSEGRTGACFVTGLGTSPGPVGPPRPGGYPCDPLKPVSFSTGIGFGFFGALFVPMTCAGARNAPCTAKPTASSQPTKALENSPYGCGIHAPPCSRATPNVSDFYAGLGVTSVPPPSPTMAPVGPTKAIG